MDTSLARRPIGQMLDGRYRVESHLADGGMASIYLGTDTRLDRTVALKIMRAEFANDEDFVRRFVAEARSVARLSHPNVVTVYDQGADGRTLYLAMEYVPGRNLRDLLRDHGRLSPREALDILDGVLAGLAAAHEAGLAHRDVKPENVLLTDSRQVKVADFGLARLLAGTSHTKSGMIIGTAAYLAPEQVSGGLADARTDVYASGVMLFELLTGSQPHTGENPLAVAYKHVNEIVPPPSSLIPGLPPALDAVVAMATSRDPDLRPGDAGQFLRAITGVRQGLPPARFPGPATGQADSVPPAAPPRAIGQDVIPPPHRAHRLEAGAGGTPPAGLPAARTSWPTDPFRTGNDLIPGMTAPDQGLPGASDGGSYQPTQNYPPGPYQPPAGNKTLIVTGTAGTSYGPPPGRYEGGPREPRIQRLLFSRRLGYLALAVVAVLLAGGFAWWQLVGRYAPVPKLNGMTVAAARSELQRLGFTAASRRPQLDNRVAKGEVISTNPAAGTRLVKGGTVTLIVSAGPHMIDMPQVTGQTLATAQDAIRHAGLVPGKVKPETSTTIPAGIVLATQPAAGTAWPQPRPVILVVSAGPPVPDFVGQPKESAEAWASAHGVSLNEVSDSKTSLPPGTVIRQSVRPGSAYTPHEVITITIAAPQMVPIPNLDGMQVRQATQTLQQLGFKVKVVKQGPFNVVVGYAPRGQAPQGSTVTLYMGL